MEEGRGAQGGEGVEEGRGAEGVEGVGPFAPATAGKSQAAPKIVGGGPASGCERPALGPKKEGSRTNGPPWERDSSGPPGRPGAGGVEGVEEGCGAEGGAGESGMHAGGNMEVDDVEGALDVDGAAAVRISGEGGEGHGGEAVVSERESESSLVTEPPAQGKREPSPPHLEP